MAEQAVVLSPRQDRPSPSAADFDAIHGVFQETARGRWFLDELNRRNRNADTLMVLDAVARIEASLAERPAPEPLPASAELAEIVREARAALGEATSTAAGDAEAGPGPAIQGLRDIIWTLRECGIDGRICDLLDRQVGLIEDGCADPAAPGRAASQARLDRLMQRLDALTDRAASPPPGEAASAMADEAPEPAAAVAAAAVVPASPLAMAAGEEPAADLPAAAQPAAALPQQEPQPKTAPAASALPDASIAATASGATPDGQKDGKNDPAPSLGAVLLADGLVPLRETPRTDALAAFARMSKAETIAFFS